MTKLLDMLRDFLLEKALPVAILAFLGIWAIRLVTKILNRALERSRMEKAAHSLIRSLVTSVLYVILGLVIAGSLGIDVTSLVALTSVVSLAVSLAMQDMLGNLISGFTLLYTQPFHSGDYVEIAGQGGTVKEIGLTYTRLATPDNKIIAIPNSAVTSAQIINYSACQTRRVEITVRASYDTPPERVIQALYQAAQMPQVLADPEPLAAVAAYEESAIAYVLRVWTATDDYWPVTYALNLRVKAVFDQAQVKMTYPHLNVHLDR